MSHLRPFSILLIVSLILLLLLAACEQTEPTPTPTDEPATHQASLNTVMPSATAVPATQTATATTSPMAVATTTASPTQEATATAVPPSATPTATPTPSPTPNYPAGALLDVSMQSSVGVLLDEIPADLRDELIASLEAEDDLYWEELALQQVRLTYNRLHFRPFFYGMAKGQLPLPPRELWQITLEGRPYRQTVMGHDLLLYDYTFNSTLLTNEASPALAEPVLADVGGQWDEPFVLPLDPTLLVQRTGNSCLNEGGFPPNSYDTENVFMFYDYSCTPDSVGAAGCHRRLRPSQSCRQALESRVGSIETAVHYQRLEWDDELANTVRLGQISSLDAPDLMVLEDDLANNRIIYRYFAPDSCAIVEACVNGTGWRRLLMFDANNHNLGTEPLDIGPVVSENPLNNMFQYNSCHDHYHFANYGEFQLGTTDQPSKQAFCVESTNRFSNNEFSPLIHPYSCRNQGIAVGWGDEYKAGLDCQWIDITDLPFDDQAETMPLQFRFNQDGFLCEGDPVLNENGELVWEPSGLRTADGLPMSRPKCDFVEGWQDNNEGILDVTIPPVGSFVTAPCTNSQLGPLRNCGFTAQPMPELPTTAVDQPPLRCTPGQTVQMSCTIPADADAQVLRVCETSALLGVGVACPFEDSLTTNTITANGRDISFTCPLPRDAEEPGGDYAFYVAPLLPQNELSSVSCTVVSE